MTISAHSLYEGTDDEDKEGQLSDCFGGAANLAPPPLLGPGELLAKLTRQINDPDITTDKLLELTERILKLDATEAFSNEKVTALSDALDKVESINDPNVSNFFNQMLEKNGYSIGVQSTNLHLNAPQPANTMSMTMSV